MPTAFSSANPEIITGQEMDTAKTKRIDYTKGLTEVALPSHMADEWKKMADVLRTLYTQLANHEAMRPNLEQTFNTPANSKNKVCFTWDFVGRTLRLLYGVPASLSNMDSKQQELWQDVTIRSMPGAWLILDNPQAGWTQ